MLGLLFIPVNEQVFFSSNKTKSFSCSYFIRLIHCIILFNEKYKSTKK